MSRLRRPADWYASWMNVDGNEKRKEVAVELLHAIREGNFDGQTLDELTQVLDHECLYLEAISYNQTQESRDAGALQKSWTSRLVTQLSDCLFQTSYPESHYERELQLRALLSALTLQRAQGVESLHNDYYESLRVQFQGRHKDIQWQGDLSGPLTNEKFRKFQCSYLLCACAEYARSFARAQPVIAAVCSKVISLVAAGGSLALAATTGWGPGSLSEITQTLNDVFTPLSEGRDARYEALFVLQEITRVALAFDLCIKAVGNSELGDTDALDSAQYIATRILQRILSLLSEYEQFEQNVSHPAAAWQHFVAFFDRGPLRFGNYYYLYGLMDCATQLGRILEKVPPPFEDRMREIVRCSKDPSLRWKAIEFLLSTNAANDIESSIPQVKDEIKVIERCLSEESARFRQRRLSSTSSLHSDLPQVTIDDVVMKPEEWTEPEEDFPFCQISPSVEVFKIPLKQRDYFSSGLSPDCKSVFFLGEKKLKVYSLRNLPKVVKTDILLERKSSMYKNARVALTDRFLAIIVKGGPSHLIVSEYGPSIEGGTTVGDITFEMWYPTCLAMYEAKDRTWVSVGGRSASGCVGSIRIYRIDNARGNLTLSRHSDFDRPGPNPLSSDWAKVLEFSPDGRRLVSLTNKNRVLIWFLSNNARPREAPFEIPKKFELEARGLESAALFYTKSNRPYILCTTSPSRSGELNGGQWPFISPVHSSPAKVPEQLEHSFWQLGRSPSFIAGATSISHSIVALLACKGTLMLFSLKPSEGGGLHGAGNPVQLREKLTKHEKSLMSTATLRFHIDKADQCLYLSAVDVKGKLLRKCFGASPL